MQKHKIKPFALTAWRISFGALSVCTEGSTDGCEVITSARYLTERERISYGRLIKQDDKSHIYLMIYRVIRTNSVYYSINEFAWKIIKGKNSPDQIVKRNGHHLGGQSFSK